MKLFFSPASPYARKVMAVAHETGLADRIEIVTITTAPVTPDAGLKAENPVAKIPTLVTQDGTALFDSRVICEYLDAEGHGTKVFPAPGPARWTALVQQALGDGILDAALLTRYERVLRPAERRWDEWEAGQTGKIDAALDRIEQAADALGRDATIGTIAIASALGYLDFRFADRPWRDARPKLAAWFAEFGERPSMVATRPQA